MTNDAGSEGGPTDDRSIDEVRERFEAAWRSGRRPLLEDQLAETSGPERGRLLHELLTVELAHRREAGETPTIHDYRDRFPEDTRVIEQTLATGGGPGATIPATGGLPGSFEDPKVPGYEILAELGRGGMGVVYRARQLQLNRVCALKTISAVGSIGEEAALRFHAEAKAIANVRHPGVVQIYHSGQHEGTLFYEMEYVEGGSLAHRLTGTAWSPSRAARLIDAVARAVDEVHHRRIVHRDLKPANILLTADGTPKVADFGLAKSLDPGASLTIAGAILGTPSYMAPEQAHGAAQAVGVATDVYALGAILYELLTGGPPFRGSSKLEVLEKIKTVEPVPPSRLVPGIPADLEAVCLKCLIKAPAGRYDTAGDLAEDLRRFLNGEPTLARPACAPPPPSPRRRWARLGVVAAAALVLALGAWFVRRRLDRAAEADAEARSAIMPKGVPYVVRAGEYPFSIAARLMGDGSRWKEMRKEDGSPLTDEDARSLIPGQTIYLPPFKEP